MRAISRLAFHPLQIWRVRLGIAVLRLPVDLVRTHAGLELPVKQVIESLPQRRQGFRLEQFVDDQEAVPLEL
jgi:hypothetical protein